VQYQIGMLNKNTRATAVSKEYHAVVVYSWSIIKGGRHSTMGQIYQENKAAKRMSTLNDVQGPFR